MAHVVHQGCHERAPDEVVRELLGGPLVHIGPDGGAVGDSVRQGQRTGVVGHDQVEALGADQLLGPRDAGGGVSTEDSCRVARRRTPPGVRGRELSPAGTSR